MTNGFGISSPLRPHLGKGLDNVFLWRDMREFENVEAKQCLSDLTRSHARAKGKCEDGNGDDKSEGDTEPVHAACELRTPLDGRLLPEIVHLEAMQPWFHKGNDGEDDVYSLNREKSKTAVTE